MLDNNILLNLVKSSTTLAVKYVHETTGKPVSDCKEFVSYFKIENGVDLPNGTITWYRCESVKPPQNNSDKVLIWRENRPICVATYWKETGHWSHNTGNWQPTHWAFINEPE